MAEALRTNISETIGSTPFELIAYDNRTERKGICQVYNQCARVAKYNLLCFLHEDVRFLSKDWGAEIARKLGEADCGVVGFAGSIAKMRYPSGWHLNRDTTRHNYRQHYIRRKKQPSHKRFNPDGGDYTPVITLDGMALFASKELWGRHPFDEQMLPGFHGYDVDFAIAAAANGYKNYVTNKLYLEHLSEGSFSEEWRTAVLKIHTKWQDKLPLFARTLPRRWLIKTKYSSIKNVIRNSFFNDEQIDEQVKSFTEENPLNINTLKLHLYLNKKRKKNE